MTFLDELWDFLNLPVGEALEKMYHAKAKQWVAEFAPAASAANLATAAQARLKPDLHYLTVTAQKTVMPHDRILFRTFYGVVHSSILMRDGTGEPRSITSFQGLDGALTALDKRAGERVVMGPRTLLELAPFKGTAIASTVALLAVEARDYAKPLLATLQKISALAGVKYFGPAKAVVEALVTGVRLLAEVAGDPGTQVAYAGNVPAQTGIFLVAATDLAKFKWSDYKFASDYTLERRGRPVDDFAYMVLTIEAFEERFDWREIPELRTMQGALDAAIRAGGSELAKTDSRAVQKVNEALIAFEWACVNCPELCASDGERVAALTRVKVKTLLARARSGLTSVTDPHHIIRDNANRGFSLEEIDAFPRP